MEADLRRRFAESLADDVGDRVSWNERVEGEGLAAIVLLLAGGRREYVLKGPSSLQPARVQADVYAACSAEAARIASRLIGLVESPGRAGATVFTAAIVNIAQSMPSEKLPDGSKAWRHMVDFNLHHRPA